MKRILSTLFIIPIYCIIFILNNMRVLYGNISNHINIFHDVEFINFNIAMVVLVVLVLLLLNSMKKYKKITCTTFFVIFSLSLLNGIFMGKGILGYFNIYMMLLAISFVTSHMIKQKFEFSIFVSVATLLLVAVVFGMLNMLVVYKYLVFAIYAISMIVSLYLVIKKSEKTTQILEKFNGQIIIIFSILFVITIIGGMNRYVHVYDEYSHWGFDAKAVIETDKLSTSEEVMSRTRSYPPVVSLWHYTLNSFLGFTEQNLYIGLSLLTIIFLMPVFMFINSKNKLLTPFIAIATIFCGYLFGGIYGFDTIYADFALSAALAAAFCIYLLFKDNRKTMLRYLMLSLAIVILIKPSGIILAGCFMIMLVLMEHLEENNYNLSIKLFFKNFKNIIKKWWKVALFLIAIFIVWNIYVKVSDTFTNDFYNYRLVPEGLETSLEYKLTPTVLGKFAYNLVKSFNDTIIYGIINLSLYQFLIIIFAIMVAIFYLTNGRDLKKAFKMVVPFLVSYIIFFILTAISMFMMFSVFEAEILASFGRYLNAFHFGLLIFIICYTLDKKLMQIGKNSIVTGVILFAIILSISFNKITYFISDYPTRMEQANYSYGMKEKFKVVNENTSKDSLVYILNQKDEESIMPMWYSRYYIFPRKTNASSSAISWKIKTEKNVDDLRDWGLTAEKLGVHLNEYDFDYLFMYTKDDLMYEQMKDMFTDYNKAKECDLFKVEEFNNTVKLVPIA